MECGIYNTKQSGMSPSDFNGKYHVHILVREGDMAFSDGKQSIYAPKDHIVIWQMSNTISSEIYSDDFEADFLVVSSGFLTKYNPEMIWASRGYVFIKNNPAFRLHQDSLSLINSDFELFKSRCNTQNDMFKEEILGRVLQIFLYDLWTVFSHEMPQTEASDHTARVFFKFLSLVETHCRQQRDVAFYADMLCITPKHLSEISKIISGIPASQWIVFYASFELASLLDDGNLTLSDVADKMNFETLSHFSRYVKKIFGISPSQYRENKNGNL